MQAIAWELHSPFSSYFPCSNVLLTAFTRLRTVRPFLPVALVVSPEIGPSGFFSETFELFAALRPFGRRWFLRFGWAASTTSRVHLRCVRSPIPATASRKIIAQILDMFRGWHRIVSLHVFKSCHSKTRSDFGENSPDNMTTYSQHYTIHSTLVTIECIIHDSRKWIFHARGLLKARAVGVAFVYPDLCRS